MSKYYKENFYDEYAIKQEDTIIAIVDSGTNARKICNELNTLYEENQALKSDRARYEEECRLDVFKKLSEENEKLKSQLYCDDEEGICNICKHHYLVKDDEAELGYYNSRCKMGHYECARISLKHCDDFESRGDM